MEVCGECYPLPGLLSLSLSPSLHLNRRLVSENQWSEREAAARRTGHELVCPDLPGSKTCP